MAMKSGSQFQTWLELANKLDLVQMLEEMKQVTIFAPTNDAFARLALRNLTENDFKRHLIGVTITSQQIQTGQPSP